VRVCVDIQAAVTQTAGVGRYVSGLVQALAACRTAGDELRLFYFDFTRRARPPAAVGATPRPWRLLPGRCIQVLWKYGRGPTFDRLAGPADVYHFPNFILPPLHAGRSVVTVHDLSFIRLPETTEERNLRYLTARIHDTVQRADRIITDSRFTAGELSTLLNVPEEKVEVVYPGLDSRFFPPDPTDVARMRLALSLPRPYLLTVGTLEPRKNHVFLVDLFEKLPDFDGDLVIVGRPGWKYAPFLERMERSRRRENLRWFSDMNDNLLAALYAGAEVMVFPSLYEGFGYPPLEALACGCPVVAAASGSLPEVLGRPGSPAVLVEGFEIERWAAAVRSALSDEELRRQARSRGPDYARHFRWDAAAKRLWEIYHSLVETLPDR